MRLVSRNKQILHVYFVEEKKTVFLFYIYNFYFENLIISGYNNFKINKRVPYFLSNVLVGVRATASIDAKKIPFYTSKTYFFYFYTLIFTKHPHQFVYYTHLFK